MEREREAERKYEGERSKGVLDIPAGVQSIQLISVYVCVIA